MGRFSDPVKGESGRFSDPGGWGISDVKFVFAWYDIWIGFYWDRKKHRLYAMIPFVGVYLEFSKT